MKNHNDCLNDKILDNIQNCTSIEKRWLKSIKAPTDEIPKTVREAIIMRGLLTMPVDFARPLVEHSLSDKILEDALGK